jgi:predicted aconitase with swiveling domain
VQDNFHGWRGETLTGRVVAFEQARGLAVVGFATGLGVTQEKATPAKIARAMPVLSSRPTFSARNIRATIGEERSG